MGGFDTGFVSNAFGVYTYSAGSGKRNVIYRKGIKMESIILRGTAVSGVYTAHPGTYMDVRSIIMDLPVSGDLANVSVTLSGAQTGAYTFNDSIATNLSFKPNEDVYITTSNFVSNYGVIINYIQVGDGQCYMQTDTSRGGIFDYAVPWRFR